MCASLLACLCLPNLPDLPYLADPPFLPLLPAPPVLPLPPRKSRKTGCSLHRISA